MFSVTNKKKKKNSRDSQHPSIYLPLAPASKNKMLSLECNGSCYLTDIQKLPEWWYLLGRRTERDAICSRRPPSTFYQICKMQGCVPFVSRPWIWLCSNLLWHPSSLSWSHPRGPFKEKKKKKSIADVNIKHMPCNRRFCLCLTGGQTVDAGLHLSHCDSVCSLVLSHSSFLWKHEND